VAEAHAELDLAAVGEVRDPPAMPWPRQGRRPRRVVVVPAGHAESEVIASS